MVYTQRLLGVCAGLALALCQAEAAQPFVMGSYAQLLTSQGERGFVLNLWSLDCPPCYRELALWGDRKRKGLPVPLVLLSTDTLDDAPEIDTVLADYGLHTVDAWVFAAPAPNLRYEIDRHWLGELPRSYLIKQGVVLEAISGVLDAQQLARWVAILEAKP